MEERTQPVERPWADFLTSMPPGSEARIADLVVGTAPWVIESPRGDLGRAVIIATPDLSLHCSSDACGGERIFAADAHKISVALGEFTPVFIAYSCRNCRKRQRLYALLLRPDDGDKKSGVAIKIGEWPPFGPPTPPRVISMVGPDRELFLKGRRAENQGLGLGAFAYYRRVVENQRGRLLREIIRAAERVAAPNEAVARLRQAAAEHQFSKSIELTKDAIPQSLLIRDHNPLLLLHRALSVGLHRLSDEECLTQARSIRVVLTELAERISQVLKDTTELEEAVSHLLTLPDAAPDDSASDTG
jgi:hypothetical protein